MASEKYTNNAETTLNGGINNSTTTVVVTSAAAFPATGQFRIIIDSEIFLVTSVSSNTFTVATRGTIDGTSAASHSDLAPVTHILTKGALDQIIADNCQSLAYASLPSAEKAGRIFLPTDGRHLFRDNGSSWDAFLGGQKVTIPPLSSAFTWLNQGVATIADTAGLLYLQTTVNASNSLSGMYKTAPSPPYTLTAHFNFDVPLSNYAGFGLFFRESSSGKCHSAQFTHINGYNFGSRKWTDATTFSADYLSATLWHTPLSWIRIADNNTNRIASVSVDGRNWKQMHSIGRTDFLTANQIGFAAFPERAGAAPVLTMSFSIDDWTIG